LAVVTLQAEEPKGTEWKEKKEGRFSLKLGLSEEGTYAVSWIWMLHVGNCVEPWGTAMYPDEIPMMGGFTVLLTSCVHGCPKVDWVTVWFFATLWLCVSTQDD
jgi:hypothetical protein